MNRLIETPLSGYTATVPITPVISAWTYTDVDHGCFLINTNDALIYFRDSGDTIYSLYPVEKMLLGTDDYIPKKSGNTLVDSLISESGTEVNINGILTTIDVYGKATFSGKTNVIVGGNDKNHYRYRRNSFQ